MKTLTKTVVTPHGPNRAAIINFVSYIHPTNPVLMRRIGWEIADDLHDDHTDTISQDNAKTWGTPRPVLKRRPVEGGFLFTQEGGAVYIPQRDLLVTITYESVQKSLDGFLDTSPSKLRITAAAPADINNAPAFVSDFGVKHGLHVSFLHPKIDSAGRILAPVYYNKLEADPNGPLHKLGIPFREATPDQPADFQLTSLLIGTFDAAGKLTWRMTQPVPCADNKSARGLCEGTVAELSDGSLAMVMRGSNHLWPDRPGCKWLSISRDKGESWSEAQPLGCDDGSLIESSATGSCLFRSSKTGGLYWIGNLCLTERPSGWGSNYPRTPFVIARVNENPVALVRNSITIIDKQQPGEHPLVQMSNFRMYEDRVTGDAVIYLTRYAERGHDHGEWLKADQYEYRVAID